MVQPFILSYLDPWQILRGEQGMQSLSNFLLITWNTPGPAAQEHNREGIFLGYGACTWVRNRAPSWWPRLPHRRGAGGHVPLSALTKGLSSHLNKTCREALVVGRVAHGREWDLGPPRAALHLQLPCAQCRSDSALLLLLPMFKPTLSLLIRELQ